MASIGKLSELNDILSNSFSNIKKDILELKGIQREQLSSTDSVKRDIDIFKSNFVDHKAFQREIRDLQSTLRNMEKKASEKDIAKLLKTIDAIKTKDIEPKDLAYQIDLKTIQSGFEELTKAINKRLNDLNKQLLTIEDSKKYVTNVSANFSNKIKKVNDNTKSIQELKLEQIKLQRTFATHDSVAETKKELVSRDEMNTLIQQVNNKLVTKEDLKAILKDFVVEDQVEDLLKSVNAEFDSVKSNIVTESKIKKFLKKYKLDMTADVATLKNENTSLREDVKSLTIEVNELRRGLDKLDVLESSKKTFKKTQKGKYEFS